MCYFLPMAVAIFSTKSVNAMAVEYPSQKTYWLSDNNVNFYIYLFKLISNIFLRIFENVK